MSDSQTPQSEDPAQEPSGPDAPRQDVPQQDVPQQDMAQQDVPPQHDAPPQQGPAPDGPGPHRRAAAKASRRAARDARRRGARPRIRMRHLGLLNLLAVLVTAFFASLFLLVLLGQSITAPDWVRREIEARLARDMPGMALSVGEVTLRLEQGWVPRVALRDMRLRDSGGRELMRLSDIETTFLPEPLLRRQVQTRSVALSGIQLNLRRNADGRFDLALGDTQYPLGQSLDLGGMVRGLDALLERPALAGLSRVEIEALTVHFDDRLSGRSWTVDGGRLSLSRDGGLVRLRGDLAVLSGGADVATLEVSYESRIGDTRAEIAIALRDLRARDVAALGPATAWLDVLRAPISGNLRASVTQAGSLGPLSATLQLGAGAVQPVRGARPVPFSSLRSYFTYEPERQMLRFDELSVVSDWVSARAEGDVFLADPGAGLRQNEMLGQLRIGEITANPASLFPAPVTLEEARADLRMRLDPFEVTLGQVVLRDGAELALLSGEVRADAEGWHLGLGGRMERLSPERLLHFWPEGAKPRTRDWIVKNVFAGTMSDVQVALRLEPGVPPDLYLGFGFEGLRARFARAMPPIEAGAGRATLLRNRFAVRAEGGHVPAEKGGQVQIAGTRFVIPDTRIKPAPAEVRLAARGSVTAALSLLDREPLAVMKKANRPVDIAEGHLEVGGLMELVLKPGQKPSDMRFAFQGIGRDIRSDKIVPGRLLSLPEAELALDNDSLEVSGAGSLGRVAVRGRWDTAILGAADGTSRVRGAVELSPAFVEEFAIALPPGSVSGRGWADAEVDLVRGQRAAFRLRSDLAGVGLRIAPLGWSLGAQRTGTLEVAGTLGRPPEIGRIALEAPGLSLEGAVSLAASGGLERARFSRIRAGGWLDAPVELVGRGKGVAPAVRIGGGRIDMRAGLPKSSGAGGGGGGPLTLALNELRVTDTIALRDLRGEFTTARGLDGNFSASVNGAAPVTGRVVPLEGRSAFRIKAADAGAVLRAAGIFKQARGGSLDLGLVPVAEAGSFDGQLRAEGVRLRDAPAMAALLSALSIVGLLEQLGGEGILFNEVDARFRLTPDRVVISESSAVGASMGISMDGVYALASGAMDMQGVVSPIYLINGIGSIFTRKGEGLLGFSYRLRGTAKEPKVQVNPLSIFTPGMFRDIFRRPIPEASQLGDR